MVWRAETTSAKLSQSRREKQVEGDGGKEREGHKAGRRGKGKGLEQSAVHHEIISEIIEQWLRMKAR